MPSFWPNKKRKAGKRRHKGRKEERTKRKSHRRADREQRRKRRDRRDRRGSRTSRHQRHTARERRRGRRRTKRSKPSPVLVSGIPQGVSVPLQHYFTRRRRRSRQDILSAPYTTRTLRPKDTNSNLEDLHSSTHPLNAITHPHHPAHSYLHPFQTPIHPILRPSSQSVLHPLSHPLQGMSQLSPSPNNNIHISYTSNHPLQEKLHSPLQKQGKPHIFHPPSQPFRLPLYTNDQPYTLPGHTLPKTPTHLHQSSHKNPFSPFIHKQRAGYHLLPQTQIYASYPLNTTARTIIHLQRPFQRPQVPNEWNQDNEEVEHQSQSSQSSSTMTLSRHTRESPAFQQPIQVFHPQAGEFLHPQAGVDISSPRLHHTIRKGRGGGEGDGEEEGKSDKEVQRECSKTLSWKKVSERR